MLFNVEADYGEKIVGYLVPDDFSITPSVRVESKGEVLAIIPCNEDRPALVSAGRHATGRCGFRLDHHLIGNLAELADLELYEDAENLLIYRRRRPENATHERIFRLETHLFPLWRLDDQIEGRFQYFNKGIDRHGKETTTQVFLLNNVPSFYVSGRLPYKAYENYLAEKFRCIAVMQDPYEELAERLLTLKHVRKFGDELLGARDMIAYASAIEFAEGIENEPKALARAFAAMPRAAIANFANPLARQLTSVSMDDPPPRGAIATALDILSTFSIVGLRERPDLIVEELSALVDIEINPTPLLRRARGVRDLTEMLRRLPEVEMLIEQDLQIYEAVKSAFLQSVGDHG